METYSTNLFELLEVRYFNTYTCVFLGVFGDEKVPFSLEVDAHTYEQLAERMAIKKESRYRLSVHPRWDPYRKKYFCSITCIHTDIFEKHYFECTDDFWSKLQFLRKSNGVVDLERIHGLHLINEDEPRLRSSKKRGTRQRAVLQKKRGFTSVSFRKVLRTVSISIIMICITLQLGAMKVSNSSEFVGIPEPEAASGFSSAAMDAGGAEVVPIDRLAGEDDVLNDAGGITGATDEVTDQSINDLTNDMVNEAASEMSDQVGDDPFIELDDLAYSLPEGYVALTFDDGPSVYTKEIVDILVEHGIDATFFFVGVNTTNFPDAVRYASDHNMAIGNHSWNHANLARKSAADQEIDLLKTNEALTLLTGAPVTFFRPPYGSMNDSLVETVNAQEMKVMMWNRDPQDWRAARSADIIQYFYDTEPSSGIYLLHESEITVNALPHIIKHLQDSDVRFASLK